MNNDVLVYITYGCKDDQVIALRVQTLGVASGVSIGISPLVQSQVSYNGLAAADGMIAIVNSKTDKRFVNDLARARELNKPVFVAGSMPIPPNLLPPLSEWLLPDEKKRVFEALRKLADAMCELREVCK